MERLIGVALFLALCAFVGCSGSRSDKTEGGIHFEVSGSGAPLVFAHGFSLDRRMWEAQEARLRSDFRVVLYDLRGHGLSDPWSEPFAAEEDMLEVFEAANLDRATIVGLSAGAQVAIDFALAHPHRVEALVLASPGLGGYVPVGSFDWMAPVISELQLGEPQNAMRAWSETPLMKIASDPVADSAMRAMVIENWPVWTYDQELQVMPNPTAITRLSEIMAPTLVMIGENDLADTKRVGDTLVACLANARLVNIPGSGHLLNLEAPGPFAEALTAFIGHGATGVQRSPAC